MELSKPLLTEGATKFYIRSSLKEVRKFKDKYITILVNILLFVLLLGGVASLLYYKYKGKLSPEEKADKEKQKKFYLFEKLHKISNEKRKEHQNLITDLPII